MGYMRAEEVLPPDVLALVQTYVDGKLLYVPKKPCSRGNWGSVNGAKEYYVNRNAAIYAEFASGVSCCVLAEKYFLSEKSIQRILRSQSPLAEKRGKHEPGK